VQLEPATWQHSCMVTDSVGSRTAQVYDMGGEEALKQGGGAGGGTPFGAGGIDPRLHAAFEPRAEHRHTRPECIPSGWLTTNARVTGEIFKQFFGAEGGSPFGDNVKFSFNAGGGGSPFGGGGSPFGGGGSPFGGAQEHEEQEEAGPATPAASQLHTLRLTRPQSGGLGLKVDGSNAVVGLTAGGAAERAGLRVGDVVFKVDGADLPRGGRLAAALGDSASHTLGVAYMKGDAGQAFEVAMPRPSGGLGIKVDSQNVVSRVQAGGAAALDGRLRVGDKILSVNSKVTELRRPQRPSVRPSSAHRTLRVHDLRAVPCLWQSLRQEKLADAMKALGDAATLRFRVLPTPVEPQPQAQQQPQQQRRGGRSRGPTGGGSTLVPAPNASDCTCVACSRWFASRPQCQVGSRRAAVFLEEVSSWTRRCCSE
jgi:hypothetical protein